MRPAVSLVLFTSLSGAGLGALVWLGALHALGLPPRDTPFVVTSTVLALALVVAGLLASTFHLRHPERAWRALSQWRSSWLSREGVMAMVTFAPALAFLGGSIVAGPGGGVLAPAGLAMVLCAVGTMICTAMIYRSLWTVPQWSNVWTVPCFLAIGLAGGALLVCAAASLGGAPVPGGLLVVALLAPPCAAAVKACAWAHAGHPAGSDLATALGMGDRLRGGRMLEAPNSSENYLQREMIFHIGRKHARKLRRGALVVGVAAPMALLAAGALAGGVAGAALTVLAAGCGLAGTLIERWLFFAEAKHKVALYYGAGRV